MFSPQSMAAHQLVCELLEMPRAARDRCARQIVEHHAKECARPFSHPPLDASEVDAGMLALWRRATRTDDGFLALRAYQLSSAVRFHCTESK